MSEPLHRLTSFLSDAFLAVIVWFSLYVANIEEGLKFVAAVGATIVVVIRAYIAWQDARYSKRRADEYHRSLQDED